MLSGVRDYEFPEGIVGIVGPNGMGKSTLINSIAWAMYGQEALPLRARDPVTWGQKECLVRVHLVLNDGQEWIVERSQKANGTGKAKLYAPDHEPKASGSAPVTNAVTELMGVDREGFLISVFARQFELDRLRSMDPSPRMQTVLRLLGINQITKAVKTVREDGNEQKKALDALRAHQIDSEALEGEIASLQAELNEVVRDVDSSGSLLVVAKEDLEKLQKQRDALEPKRRAYMSYLNDLQARKTTLLLAQGTFDRLSRETVAPEPEKPKEPEYKEVQSVSEEEVAEKKDAYLKIRDAWIDLRSQLDAAKDQLDNLKDTCPTCNRPFDDAEHIDRERQRLKLRMASLNAAMTDTAKLGDQVKVAWENAGHQLSAANQTNQFNARLEADFLSQLRQYELTMAHREQTKQAIIRAKRELEDAQSALDSLKEVEDVSEEERRLQIGIDQIQLRINHITEQLAANQSDKRTLESEIERLHNSLKDAREGTKQAVKLEKEVVTYETTAAELQKLKEKMIGGIIPALNERASSLVEVMTDGKYSELCLTPDYEIEYRNHLGELKNFLNLSGGEQTVFALSLRLAISDLRAGNLGVLFLDEAISNLSSEDGRQESVWQAIESLTSRFKQTFVITHVEAYKDRAPFTVRL